MPSFHLHNDQGRKWTTITILLICEQDLSDSAKCSCFIAGKKFSNACLELKTTPQIKIAVKEHNIADVLCNATSAQKVSNAILDIRGKINLLWKYEESQVVSHNEFWYAACKRSTVKSHDEIWCYLLSIFASGVFCVLRGWSAFEVYFFKWLLRCCLEASRTKHWLAGAASKISEWSSQFGPVVALSFWCFFTPDEPVQKTCHFTK